MIINDIVRVLQEEAKAILALKVDKNYQKTVEIILNCEGKVITTGMGKAGHVARKIAATFCSTGTASAFIHPGEAGHGDLGLIQEKDIIIAFSTSGKTQEVIKLLKLSKKLNVQSIIAITSHKTSKIKKYANITIDMGIINEPCPFGITPSSSTTTMMAIGDALAITVMKNTEFSISDFGLRHHAGYIGKHIKSIT